MMIPTPELALHECLWAHLLQLPSNFDIVQEVASIEIKFYNRRSTSVEKGTCAILDFSFLKIGMA